MKNANIHSLLRRNAVLYAERTALECEGRRITHAQLLQNAARTGNAFLQAGARFGDRIAILARNSIEMVETLCACELFGFIAVPLNHRLAEVEIATIVADCTPTLVIVDREFLSTVERVRQAQRNHARVFVIDATSGDVDSLKSATEQAPDTLRERAPSESDAAYIIYTSGSTGRPKGVVLSHGGLVEGGRLLASPAGVRPDSTQIVVMPLFHVGATAQRMGYVVHGGTLLLHPRFDADLIVADIAAGRVTDIHLAPTMLRSVLDAMNGRPAALGALESVKYASSPIPDDTLGRAMSTFGPKLIQYYALTEAGGIGTALHKYVHAEAAAGQGVGRLRSAGQSHLGCDIEIRRADGTRCPVGQEGEIWLRSDSVMSCYWNNPTLTADALVDGWLRTGDVGRLDDECFLYIVDRLKDMIVSGGENIYSSEVERALEAHPAVLEAAVIGIPDVRWGEAVHAFVVLRPAAGPLDPAELVDFCKARLASYKKPRSIDFLDALPRLQHVQKIDKPSLRKAFWGTGQRAVN